MKLSHLSALVVAAALVATPVLAKGGKHPKTEADCKAAGGEWKAKGKGGKCNMSAKKDAAAPAPAAAPAEAAPAPAPAEGEAPKE